MSSTNASHFVLRVGEIKLKKHTLISPIATRRQNNDSIDPILNMAEAYNNWSPQRLLKSIEKELYADLSLEVVVG